MLFYGKSSVVSSPEIIKVIQSAYAMPDRAKMEQEQRSLMLTGEALFLVFFDKCLA